MKKLMPMMAIMIVIILVGAVYAYQGVVMHNKVPTEELKFHALQSTYFSISKAERDSATTDSELNFQLVEIKNYPSTLLELKLVGIGKILAGIFLVLLAILMALVMMPIRLSQLIKKG